MPVIFDHGKFALASPEFHWPDTGEDRAYSSPMERAGGLLVRELARVGWEVPGIEVAIDTYGQGDNLIRRVRKISGATEAGPFSLRFSAQQAHKGRFNVMTGLSEATIPPGLQIVFYDDRSGPTGYLYLGKDWKADGAAWMNDAKVNSKLNNKPKTYLRYSGHGGRGMMAHDSDLGREYSPDSRQPTRMDSNKVAAQVVEFIEGLISKLSKMPSAPGFDDVTPQGDANLRRLAAVERIPAPADFPLLYSWVERNDAYRLNHMDEADSHDKYGLSGNGWRLCAMGARASEMPERARDGFSYASTDPTVEAGHVIYGVREDSSPTVVKLKWLNDVFVVDNAAFDHAIEEMRGKIKTENRDRLTDSELDQCIAATARTLTPVTEYTGGFEKPIYVIGRQTEVDEARLVKGAVELSQTDSKTRVVVRDEETGSQFEVFSRDATGERAVASGERAAVQYANFHSTNGHYRNSIAREEALTHRGP